MKRKLINKTQRAYFAFSIATFAIVAPIFYLITEKIYIKEAEESLMYDKSEFLENSLSTLTLNDIETWNRINNDIKIQDDRGLRSDTIFNSFYFNNSEGEDDPYRELNTPIRIGNKPFTLSIKVNLVESNDLILSIATLFFVLVILLFTGLIIITRSLSLRLWRPFYDTLRQIEKFEIDKNSIPELTASTTEEFERLNDSVKRLVERNISIFQSQREFIENAAHELQTPIAVFKGKIDLLMQRPDLTEGQSEILESINSNISRLTRMNRNLLLLSKIDRDQFSERTSFSVHNLIEKQLIFFLGQSAQKKLTIEKNLIEDAQITANIALTEILLSNLLLNAIQHNVEDGKIIITLEKHHLTISNTGDQKEIKPDNLFNRFSKLAPADKGNGLGLAIVKRIADLYQWELSYQFNDHLHSFVIEF